MQAQAPHVLPTPEQELEWLLETLKTELFDKLEDLNNIALPTKIDQREAREILWTFAVLWKDPPISSPDSVQRFLERNSLKELVQEYFALL